MADFDSVDIELNHYTDNWGPFIFYIPSATSQTSNDGLIPYGATLADATIRAFIGVVRSGTTLDDYTEITDNVIDTDVVPIVEADKIRVYFNYPGSQYKGKKITVVFECLLTTGAQQAFFFNSLVIN